MWRWDSRDRDQVVANSVPDTQPIAPQHPKFFYRSELRSSIFATSDLRQPDPCPCFVATSTISKAWQESSEFESQAGVARSEAIGVGIRRHDRSLNRANVQPPCILIV